MHINARGEEELVEMTGHKRISMEEVSSSIWRLKEWEGTGSLWGHCGVTMESVEDIWSKW